MCRGTDVLVLHFAHFFALLLWGAAVLAWIAGMPQLGVAIVGVVIVNGAFSFWQEHEAEQAVEALEALLPRQANVRRDGREQRIAAAGVVPGDVLVLAEGDVVAADARLVVADRLRVDLSALTGESRPVARTAAAVNGDRRPLPGYANLVFGSTSVAGGRAEAVVFAAEAHTEFGRIARLTHSQRERPSPLERELRRVMRVVTLLASIMGAGFFAMGIALGGLDPLTAFLFGVGILVASVPEGLLPTLTLSLALGARPMARRRALVKRLSALEALGATTIILTDKTGTLTENEMTVRSVRPGRCRRRHRRARFRRGRRGVEGRRATPTNGGALLRCAHRGAPRGDPTAIRRRPDGGRAPRGRREDRCVAGGPRALAEARGGPVRLRAPHDDDDPRDRPASRGLRERPWRRSSRAAQPTTTCASS